MRRVRSFLLRLRGMFQRARQEQDLNEVFEGNLTLHIEDNLRSGMPPEEARRQAVLAIGSIELAKQNYRDRMRLPFLETFFYDLRYAARSLARSRIFTAVAVSTLALGIGASTAMFTVAQAVLLRPLPYAQPDRLVAISEVDRLKPSKGANVASADFAEWQRGSTAFSGMASYVGIDERGKARIDLFLTGAGETSILKGLVVGANLFDVLGVAPVRGRNFGSEDHAAILSYRCWQTQFAGDPHIIGRSITLSGLPRDVIGIMPPGFFFPNKEVDVFIPPGNVTPDRVFHDMGVIARLRPGVSLQQAIAQMAAIGARLQRQYPQTNANLNAQVDGWHAALAGSNRTALLMLFAAVGVLFAIVCSNLAHLQLGRMASRRQEFGVRKALGASRGRLVHQLLTENLLLSMLGGLLGFCLATAARAALLRFAPDAIPSYADLRIDSWVILFNLLATLLAPVLFGIGPALSAARPDHLRDRAGSSTSSKRTRGFLVIVEVTLSVVLVVCAGLLIRSFVRLENVDLGFRADHTLSFRLDMGEFVPSEEQRARQYAEIESRLLEQPGIEAAGATARPVLGGGSGGEATVTIQGQERTLRLEIVSPAYFLAMRTPLLRGRFPTRSETKKADLVAVVNSAFENFYFPDHNSVGKQIVLGRRGPAAIVGVVADLKQEGIDKPADPAAFIPWTQITPPAVTFFVRGRGDRHALVTAARAAVRSVNRSVPLANVATLDELVQASISGQRVRTLLLSLVAGAALFLAALGVYGVLSYSIVQRSAEISIRMALGASGRRLVAMILFDGMRPVMIGCVLGFAGAYVASSLIQSLLFGIVPVDPPTYLLTVLILATVSLCACAVPAVHAIRVDPMASLRRG